MKALIQIATQFAPQLLFLAFLIITFATSTIDKLTDWKGNIAYFNAHFSNTFLQGKSSLLLGFLTFIEGLTTIVSSIGIFQIYYSQNMEYGLWAGIIAAKTLLLMLLGQRITKDYAGAMTITVYFAVTLFGVALFA